MAGALSAVGSFLYAHYHKDWVDPATVIVACVYATWRHLRTEPRKKINDPKTGRDLLDGTAVFPLLLLMGAVFSRQVVEGLLSANKVILFAAGAMALFAILED